MPSNHLILCRPLLLLPSIFPASGSFAMSVLRIKWPKYWSFSFTISPSNEYSGLISFRIDWLDLLAVQGTLKSLLKHEVQKYQFFGPFFIVQLSHPYMTNGKTKALTRWTFIGKVISLLFNMLSRLVITFFFKEEASFNFMAAVTICSDFAKSLQSFPTLCDPRDGSPPGSPVPGILQARTLEWAATSFSNA